MMMMMMTETSRDDKHAEDVMVQLMFGMLCPPDDEARPRGRCCHRRQKARPMGRSSATTGARAGGADPPPRTK